MVSSHVRRQGKAGETTAAGRQVSRRDGAPTSSPQTSSPHTPPPHTPDSPPADKDPSPPAALIEPGTRTRLVAACGGDHVAIHRLLTSVFHAPSAAEFQTQLEDPRYEPPDRLLVKRGEQIVSHLRTSYREVRFGPLSIPACLLCDLATLPEYRRRGFAAALLAEAQRRMQRDGIRLGLLRTRCAPFYARQGWEVCFRHSYCTAGARDLLAALSARARPDEQVLALGNREPRPELTVRLWRHVEQAGLMRLYDHDPLARFGPIRRDETYWRWLVSRRNYDRIYVAMEGADKGELEDTCRRMMGYAALREGRIVELITAPQRQDVAWALVQRAGMDAIEHDDHVVRLDAPPAHPLREMFLEAGGKLCYHEAEQGEVYMVRLFRPLAFLAQQFPLLVERAREAGLALPCELGLLLDDQKVDGQKYRLVLSRRSAKVVPGKLGRSYIKLSSRELTPLLLGHGDIDDYVEQGRIHCSTTVAQETARILLPRLPLWLPPWDDLPAIA